MLTSCILTLCDARGRLRQLTPLVGSVVPDTGRACRTRTRAASQRSVGSMCLAMHVSRYLANHFQRHQFPRFCQMSWIREILERYVMINYCSWDRVRSAQKPSWAFCSAKFWCDRIVFHKENSEEDMGIEWQRISTNFESGRKVIAINLKFENSRVAET